MCFSKLRQPLVFFVFIAFVVVGESARADLFYGIDIVNDQLVTFDSSSGNVQVVGSLGQDVAPPDVSLAMYNGSLYGVFSHSDQRADLFEINRQTGQMTFMAQLMDNGAEVTLVESIVATPTGLRVSYTTSSGSGYHSPMLGDLSLDGQVTGGFDTGVDIDALTLLPDGQLFAIDSRSSDGVFSFNLEPTEFIGSYNVANTGPGDIDYSNGMVWGISPAGLVEIDPTDGSLVSITALSIDGGYNGFTAVAVPEPRSSLLCATVLCGVLFRLRRRPKRAAGSSLSTSDGE